MKRFTTPFFCLTALVCLWAAGSSNRSLAEQRSRHNPDAQILRDAPPLMAFTTVVLGGFRGIIADILWLRLAYLQDAGDYFEMIQLADWITKLEPRCTEIWSFHAWNMSYNVSVMMVDPDDRWRWVNSGIRLLQSQGIRFNPADPELYAQLAWIYLHKISREIDETHAFYKSQLAKEMEGLLGSPHPDFDRLFEDQAKGKRLREEYRLDPAAIREFQSRYGKLDWFRPETHALYWAHAGSQLPHGNKSFMCERIVEQSLKALQGPRPSLEAPFRAGSTEPNE